MTRRSADATESRRDRRDFIAFTSGSAAVEGSEDGDADGGGAGVGQRGSVAVDEVEDVDHLRAQRRHPRGDDRDVGRGDGTGHPVQKCGGVVRADLDDADCLIVIAGMEGALPSVVGGLVGVPLVAVPTSVGYGASYGGLAALLAMLNSCAPGVVVTNIDNGFGAGVHAARVARRAAPR